MSRQELLDAGFAEIGENVQVSRKASIYGASRIKIGDNSRIDDFCVLSAGEGGIEIGRHVHIAVMCTLIGAERITIEDFGGLSARVSVYSSSDDYSGKHMTNPTVPIEFTNVKSRPVAVGRHVIIGTGSVILPGANIESGAAVGALSLVVGKLTRDTIYGGSPAKALKPRATNIYGLEKQLDDQHSD